MDAKNIINLDSPFYKHGYWIGTHGATAALKRWEQPPALPEKPAGGDQLQEWFGMRDGQASSVSRTKRGLIKIKAKPTPKPAAKPKKSARPAPAEPVAVPVEKPSEERLRGRADGLRLASRRLAKGEHPDKIKLRIPAGSSKEYRTGLDEGKRRAIDDFFADAIILSPAMPAAPLPDAGKVEFESTKAQVLELLRAGNSPDEIFAAPAERGELPDLFRARVKGRLAAIKEYEREPKSAGPEACKSEFESAKAQVLELLRAGNSPEEIILVPAEKGEAQDLIQARVQGRLSAIDDFDRMRRAEIAAMSVFDSNSAEYCAAFEAAYRIAMGALRKGTPAEQIKIKSLEEMGGGNRYFGALAGMNEAVKSFELEKIRTEIFERTRESIASAGARQWVRAGQ